VSGDTVTAVVTADNHLNRYYDRMPPQRLEQRRRYLRRGFHQAVEYAVEHQVDLFLQAGDLFDTPDPRNLDREFVASELGRLRAARVRVYGVGGNHDTPKQRTEQGAALPQGIYSELGALHLFEGDGVPTEMVDVNGLRVAIGALPWSPTVGAGRDPLEGVDWAPESDLGIFLFHHSIEGHIFPGANESIVSRASLDRLRNTQLVIAGHVHHGADWRMGPMQVLIPGATELMTFGEAGMPSFSVVELAPGGGVTRLDRIKVDHQRRRTVTVRSTDLEDAGDLCAAIIRRVEPSTDSSTMVRVVLEGPLTREAYRGLDLPRLFEFGFSHAFHFDVDSSGLFIQEETGQRAAGGVRISQPEELTSVADELICQAGDPCERALLEETKQSILAFYESEVAA
jgi:DNA repair exonuclease SbcCD nuclease subunit